MPRLIFNPGAEDAQAFELQPGIYSVGRTPENTLCIPDDSLSSHHARITVSEEGVVLRDLGSSNGSFVEETPVTEARLVSGQRIRFGTVEFRFEDTCATHAATQAPVRPKPRVRVALPTPTHAESTDTLLTGKPASGGESALGETAAFAGETYCRFHPHGLAQYYCRKCRKYLCALCVAPRPHAGKMAHCCRACGQPCQPVTTAVDTIVEETFGTLAARAFRYPFEKGGAFLVVTGTLFILLLEGAARVVSFAWIMGLAALVILSILGGGYLFAFVKAVVLSSAQGSDTLPDWPDISDVTQEVVLPFFQNLGLLVFCLGPGLALLGYGGATENPSVTWGGGVLLFLGVCYIPMALLGISLFDSVAGLNPMLGLPSIAQTLGHYLITLFVFFLILGAKWGLDHVFTRLPSIPFLPSLFGAFLDFYSVLVVARTVGVLYRVNAQALGWFERRPR